MKELGLHGSWHSDWFLNLEGDTRKCWLPVAWDADMSLWRVKGPWAGTTPTQTEQISNVRPMWGMGLFWVSK